MKYFNVTGTRHRGKNNDPWVITCTRRSLNQGNVIGPNGTEEWRWKNDAEKSKKSGKKLNWSFESCFLLRSLIVLLAHICVIHSFVRLIDWLLNWLISQSIDRFIHSLIGHSFVRWLIDLIDWLIDCLLIRSLIWLIDWLIYWFIGICCFALWTSPWSNLRRDVYCCCTCMACYSIVVCL